MAGVLSKLMARKDGYLWIISKSLLTSFVMHPILISKLRRYDKVSHHTYYFIHRSASASIFLSHFRTLSICITCSQLTIDIPPPTVCYSLSLCGCVSCPPPPNTARSRSKQRTRSSGAAASSSGSSSSHKKSKSKSTSKSKEQGPCSACGEMIIGRHVVAHNHKYHIEHFVCSVCHTKLAGQPFVHKDGVAYCEDDFYRRFNPPCGACNHPIKGRYVSALGQAWHPDHFVCVECNAPFASETFKKYENRPFCHACFEKCFGTRCSKCGHQINGRVFEAMDKKFHLDCFTCEVDGHAIGAEAQFHVYDGKVYCGQHFEELFLETCSACHEIISEEYVKVFKNIYHPECWKCETCGTTLSRDTCEMYKTKFYCPPCHKQAVTTTVMHSATNASSPSTRARARHQRSASEISASSSRRQRSASPASSHGTGSAHPAPTAPTGKAPSRPRGLSRSKPEQKRRQRFYSYTMLKNNVNLPDFINLSRKEQYLPPSVFQKLFKMNREEFNALKPWKKKRLKLAVGLDS
jgi:paxillin